MDGAIPELRATNAETTEAAQTAARAAGLRYVSDRDPGITRIKTKAGFRYLDARTRKPVKDDDTIARIIQLAIPPAYKDVWICAQPKGHLQATGIDARGRKQYRYHAQWRAARDGSKFERMIEFGEALPKLRRKIKRDLALPGLPRDKVLAVLAALLDSTLIRVGNVEYARSNQSFGLTTLRDRHVQFVRDGRAMFRFRAKGGVDREVVISDKRLARIVRACRQIPGQQLFQYLDDDGQRHGVDSGQLNDYLRTALGARDGDEGFTAKDFRTWGGTLRAIALMGCTPLPAVASERALTTCIVCAIKQVASELGNTPAVCKKSYINPVVFEAWRAGHLHRVIREDLRHAPRRAEQLALSFLKQQARRSAKK
ncbi:DNA topoisomerase IB [Hydrocarboniphaga sp.]|uniref:DNA topoisomerase IB n=1 Tax=Hydrocarboniphaga sp. TaxID=2033016 RepID=UPI003D11C42F